MKNKNIYLITLFITIISLTNIISYAKTEEYFELQFKVMNNDENQNIEIYLLLPKEYIEFTIQNEGLNINYEGANTLKENTISSINVDKTKIQDDIYEEDGVEYIQILLDKNEEELYNFNILSSYEKLDMKYRIKTENEDYIVHIDNFKIENNKCEIEYNVEENIVKQPDKKVFSIYTIILIIILVIIVILGIISYVTQRNR